MEIFAYPIQYYLIPVVLLIVLILYGLWGHRKGQKVLAKGLDIAESTERVDEKFVFNDKSEISDENYRKLIFASLLSVIDRDYVNDLKSIQSKTVIREILKESWDIQDKDSFYEIVESLFDHGHSIYYPECLNIATSFESENERMVAAKALPNSFDEDVYKFVENILESREMIEKKGALNPNMQRIDVLAWDMGRVIYLARLAYSLDFINEREAWIQIDKAVAEMSIQYETWEEIARACMLGRNMWNGDCKQLVLSIDAYMNLVNEQESPLRKIAFG